MALWYSGCVQYEIVSLGLKHFQGSEDCFWFIPSIILTTKACSRPCLLKRGLFGSSVIWYKFCASTNLEVGGHGCFRFVGLIPGRIRGSEAHGPRSSPREKDQLLDDALGAIER